MICQEEGVVGGWGVAYRWEEGAGPRGEEERGVKVKSGEYMGTKGYFIAML